jgi:glycosyltransferase involved in cell wall biosynthesis
LVEDARTAGRASRACLIPDIPSSLAEASRTGIAGARARCARQPDDLLIAYVGSFAVYQGIDLLFKSIPLVAREEARARFVIIGGSPAEIEARKAELAGAGVPQAAIFLGHIDPDRLPDYLAAADILLSPRLTGVNTPLKLLDYLKAGAAIVATDCAANKLILDASLAQLTPPEPEAFSAGILKLCRDRNLRLELSRGGAKLLRERHNFSSFRDALRQCYEYVLS